MDFPTQRQPPPAILTPFNATVGNYRNTYSTGAVIGGLSSGAWPVTNKAYYYPFTLHDWAIAYQLLFWVGAAVDGNVDVGIYDSQLNKIVSAGSTAMGTANTVQELNITDTELPPGDYFLAGACSSSSGTTFSSAPADEVVQSSAPVYEQASAFPLPSPATPVPCTDANPPTVAIGIQFVPTF